MATVSFRSQTTVSINDLCEDHGLRCIHTQRLVAGIAGALLSFREEGVEYSPEVLVTVEASGLVRGLLPGAVAHKLGEAPVDQATPKAILKECATLAVSGWSVWVERGDDSILRYGVVYLPRLPTALTLKEAITLASPHFGILIQREGTNTVTL